MEEVPDEAKWEARGRESREAGEREREERDKARRRLFKVRCKLRRPSAASIGRLFVHPPTQKQPLSILLRPPDPAGAQRPDSLTTLSLSSHPVFFLLPLSAALSFCLSFSLSLSWLCSYPRCFFFSTSL